MNISTKTSFFLLLLFLSSAGGAVEIPIQSQRTLRQQVDLYVELLTKEISKVKTLKEKVAALNRVASQVQEVRRDTREASEIDRQYTEYLIAGFKVVPPAKRFKTKNCDVYQSQIAQLAKVSDAPRIAAEALMPTESLLQAVCAR